MLWRLSQEASDELVAHLRFANATETGSGSIMPTSTLDDVIAAFRRSILRDERTAASAMVRAYAAGWKRVKSKLNGLQTEYDKTIARGEPVGLNWIYQNSRLTDMQVLIGKELGRFSTIAGTKITAAQRKVIEESLTFSRDEMILRLGPDYDVSDFLRVTSLPVKSIEAMVGMNRTGAPLRTLFQGIKADGAQEASDALVEGMMLGYNPRKIAPMIRDALGTQLSRALTISRTEVMRAQRLATEANYNANSDVVKGWRWEADLGSACEMCTAMHGTEHPLSESMSSHQNCRCSETSLLLTWEEIGEQFGHDFTNVDGAGPTFEEIAKKYNMSTEQIARYQDRQLTGEAYFNNLKADEQRDLLGQGKYDAWKDGRFEFSQLVKDTYSPVWGEGKGVASLRDLLGE